jgi:hypothetical protein
MKGETRAFGPFLDVPADAVSDAGFHCLHCRRPVERFAQVIPDLVPRMLFYGCPCGTVVVFEDEAQPNQKLWWHNIKLLKKTGAKVLVFNGNRPLEEGFSGVN